MKWKARIAIAVIAQTGSKTPMMIGHFAFCLPSGPGPGGPGGITVPVQLPLEDQAPFEPQVAERDPANPVLHTGVQVVPLPASATQFPRPELGGRPGSPKQVILEQVPTVVQTPEEPQVATTLPFKGCTQTGWQDVPGGTGEWQLPATEPAGRVGAEAHVTGVQVPLTVHIVLEHVAVREPENPLLQTGTQLKLVAAPGLQFPAVAFGMAGTAPQVEAAQEPVTCQAPVTSHVAEGVPK